MIAEKNTNIKHVLEIFGVNESTHSSDEKNELDQNGYIVIKHVIDPAWLWELSHVFESVFKTEGYLKGRAKSATTTSLADYIKKQFNVKDEDYKGPGLRKVLNIVNEGPVFDRIYTHSLALAAAYHTFGQDFKLSSLTALEAVPEEGDEEFQADDSVKVIWMLDDFTPENGGVRIAKKNNEEIEINAPAGSICILKPNVRYAQTKNNGGANRRFLYCDFIKRNEEQELNQEEYIRVSTYDRIIPAARYILEV